MFLEKLRLRDFRIYESLDIEFSSGTTVFLGSNGAGKTTILEAVYMFATLQSFRTTRLKDLVRQGTSMFSAELTCQSEVREQLQVEVSLEEPKRLFRNGKKTHGPAFIRGLHLVALAPEHQKLLESASEERRKFLDRLIFSRNPGYLETTRRYQKAMRHKRALLRKELPWPAYQDQVAVWNEELIQLSGEIRSERERVAGDISPAFQAEHGNLGEGQVELQYQAAEEDLGKALRDKGQKEFAAGRVLYGAHRDEVGVFLRGRPAHQGASQGERSSLLLALKLSEMRLIQASTDDPTVLLLDDLGATLDTRRRSRLFERIGEAPVQTLITTTDDSIAKAAGSHEKGALEICLDENPSGFSFAPRVAT